MECSRCIQDSSVPGISFDAEGVCNYCHLHRDMEQEYPNDEIGRRYLNDLFARIKRNSVNKEYDIVAGISGGRDSTYLLYTAVKVWKLRVLAVHFNDGFDNPVAGENILNAVKKLNVKLITVTSNWKEAKALKISFLKASVPDLNLGTDIGIASALYGVAYKYNVKNIFIGQSFRTEGIKPLEWSYFDGDYLRKVHYRFSDVRLAPWKPENPQFNLGIKELFFYSAICRIKVHTPFYYWPYIRKEADQTLKQELDWVYPGAHYFDDLYHSLIKYVHRVKFGIDLNMNSDSALVRSGQMEREEALERKGSVYKIEQSDVIRLCIKRLGIDQNEFEEYLSREPKRYYDYPNSYRFLKMFKPFIWIASRINLVPRISYKKYFHFGVKSS